LLLSINIENDKGLAFYATPLHFMVGDAGFEPAALVGWRSSIRRGYIPRLILIFIFHTVIEPQWEKGSPPSLLPFPVLYLHTNCTLGDHLKQIDQIVQQKEIERGELRYKDNRSPRCGFRGIT